MREGAKRQRARELRRDMTLAERRLWLLLKQCQVEGLRFRRQHPIGPYIADFTCLELGLVVEVDGSQHQADPGASRRDALHLGQGFVVLRFWNNEVLANSEGVRAAIVMPADGIRLRNQSSGE